MNDIVKFSSDSGDEVQITKDDVRRLICESATDKEISLFLAHCAAHKLDPIGSKDAYLVKYGESPASIITAYQVFNRRARNFPDYAGIKSGVVTLKPNGQIQHKQGSAVYPDVDGRLIGGWAEVYVKGWTAPAYCEVSMADYAKPDARGKNGWSRFPGVMIEKVAKASAWRLAYPSEFSGMYTAEEMAQAQQEAPEPTYEIDGREDTCVSYQMASDAQLEELMSNSLKFAEMKNRSLDDVISAVNATKSMKDAGYVDSEPYTSYQCEVANEIVTSWIDRVSNEPVG